MSKKLIKQLFNFLVVITNSTLFLHGLTQAEQKFVEKYAPPKELQTQLEQIFPDKDLISSLTQKSICGTTSTIQELQERIEKFEIIKTKHTDKLTEIICQHPQIPDFIIKIAASGHKYRNMTRVISASEMNEYLQIKNITNVIVPKKYLYQIPNTTDFEDENFIVIAEKLNILNEYDSEKAIYKLNSDVLKNLKKLIRKFNYSDVSFDNVTVTTDKSKIAIIDTECFNGLDKNNLKNKNPGIFSMAKGLIKLRIHMDY
jgi:hypothetical protein